MKKRYQIATLCISLFACIFLMGCSALVTPIERFFDVNQTSEQEAPETEHTAEITPTVAESNQVDETVVSGNYYYSLLTPDQQTTYRQLVSGFETYATSIDVTASSTEEVHNILQTVLYDYPEFFWINGNSSVTDMGTGHYIYEPSYNMDLAEVPNVQAQIDSVYQGFLAGIAEDDSTYWKVRGAYEWVIRNCDYNTDSIQNQNIQSVMLYHSSVCAGYAKTFQYYMKRLGIPCIYVTGTAVNAGSSQPHGWNMVAIDGQYYEVDCTWGEPRYQNGNDNGRDSIFYDYLCITSNEINRTHVQDTTYTYPICGSTQYDFYRLFSNYFTEYSEDGILQAMYDTIDAGEDRTYLKFAAEADYLRAKAGVEDKTLTESPARQKMEQEGLQNYQFSYVFRDDLYLIKIYW